MGKKGVIFDMDGTVLDTLGDLTAAVNRTLTVFGYPLRSVEEVGRFVGNGPRNLLKNACPADTTEETLDAVLAAYLPDYAAHNRDTTAPYPGVPEMLVALQAAGYTMGVVSNKQEPDVEALRQLFFADTLTVAVGDLPGRPRKPAPDGVLAAMKRLGLDPAQTWFVGDSEVDVATAQNAGLRCIAVTWGFRDRAALVAAGAEILADAPQQVEEIIQQMDKE